ncbi:MAG: hypothetical protein ACON5A_00635 [Candidatus Comchoanobacterales bacterium]
MQRANVNHGKFFAILLAFFLPLLLAHLIYASGFKGKTSNLGQWADDHASVEKVIKSSDSKPLSLPQKWHLILWQQTPFDAAAQKHITQIDNLHILLRRDMDRLQPLVLTTQTPPKHATIPVIQVQQIPQEIAPGNWRSLVDPDGRIVLNYPQEQPIEDTMKDLKRLLKFRQDS